MGLVSLWPSSCVQATRDRTPLLITSSWSNSSSTSYPAANPRPGKSVLIRTDTAGGTHDFVEFLTKRRLSYSVGWMLPGNTPELYRQLSELGAWEPAYDTNGDPREGADVAELTGVLDLAGWPEGMRIIVRRERPHPGAQLRFDDVDGYRVTAFARTRRAGSWRIWKSVTDPGLVVRIGSASPRTPGYAISR